MIHITNASKFDTIQNINKEIEMNMGNQTLVCWIGDTDILVMGKTGKANSTYAYFKSAKKVWENDKPTTHKFDSEIEKLDTTTRNSSIILALTGSRAIPKFSRVLLLTNRPSNDENLIADFKNTFASFIITQFKNLKGNVRIEFVPSDDNPLKGVDGWNYAAVYNATKKILSQCIKNGDNPNDYWFNITPGTIAQSTSLILVGKEISHKAQFIQVEKSRNRVDHCDIPFDISAVLGNGLKQLETANGGIIGTAPSFRKAMDKAEKIAWAPVSVLLTGPSGAGKEIFAREIHRMSGRPADKFVAINCAMLTKELGRAELTGYFKGTYTGADKTTPGKFEAAKGGTLFLDEIGDCPLDVQTELLRFLQPPNGENPSEREWELLGNPPNKPSDDEKKYCGKQHGDIRVIAATNRNLLDSSTFRQDLYFRLETIQIPIPSLEERKAEKDTAKNIDDVKQLADFFLAKCNAAFKFPKEQRRTFSDGAYDALQQHKWVGNVRELQNVVTRLALLCTETTITDEDVMDNLNQEEMFESKSPIPTLDKIASELAHADVANCNKTLDERMDEFKHAYCLGALHATGGNKKQAYTTIKTNAKTFDKAISTHST